MLVFSINPEEEILGTLGLIVSAGFSLDMLLTAKYETKRDITTIMIAT